MILKGIDQVSFESWVPAFASADSQIFDLISPELEQQKMWMEDFIGDIKVKEIMNREERIQELAQSVVCMRAAIRMIPQMDITMTPDGFGVVRNDHITPASKERVESLVEGIKEYETANFDRLRMWLAMDSDWGESRNGKNTFSLLFWCPAECEFYGAMKKGFRMIREEYEAQKAEIAEAESLLQSLISPELYERILQFWKISSDNVLVKVRELSCKLVAAHLLGEKAARTCSMTRYQLQKFLNLHKEQLPEYANSDIVKSYGRVNKNKKDGNAFFFS